MVSVSLKENQSGQTRSDKLNVVSNYINKHLDVGDVDHPRAFFKVTIPMRWEDLGRNFVYFTIITDQTVLGLGCSMHHIIEQQKKPEVLLYGSTTPGMRTY